MREFLITAENADIAVVYYAGHGVEIGGTNYLIPVDAKLGRDYDVEDEASHSTASSGRFSRYAACA